MAEVQVKEDSGKGGKVRAKKHSTRVDMTPMVDLGFLLITFFMFTTTFSKPNVMNLGLPAKPDPNAPKPPPTEIDLSNSISFLIGKNDKVYWHQLPKTEVTAQNINEASYDEQDSDGIAKVIENAKKKAKDPTKWTIIIKPTDDASYKNFVDVMDELAVTKSEQYGVTDISPQEKAALNAKVAQGAAPTSNP